MIHLFGFAKAFGYADLPLLGHTLSKPVGVLWLTAALLCLAAAAALFLVPRWWWVVGALAVVTSQAAIVTAWSDAMVGTVANLLLAVAVLWADVVGRPWVNDFRATFTGRIRSGRDSPWMRFTGDQLDILDTGLHMCETRWPMSRLRHPFTEPRPHDQNPRAVLDVRDLPAKLGYLGKGCCASTVNGHHAIHNDAPRQRPP